MTKTDFLNDAIAQIINDKQKVHHFHLQHASLYCKYECEKYPWNRVSIHNSSPAVTNNKGKQS